MAWANSKIFSAIIHDALGNTSAIDLDSDASIKAALYNDTVTPNQLVTAANSCYAAGVWTGGSSPNIVDTGTGAPAGWPYAGIPLTWGSATRFTTYVTATVKFDADDTPSASNTTTLTAAFGTLVYDDTMAAPVDQGICYNYFGGTNSVTLGTFTIVWHGSGIFTLAL
jgi:hypothetical protein